MSEKDIKAKVADEMRALLPLDAFRTTITPIEQTEDSKRERQSLGFTVEISQPDPDMVRGLAESLIRKHIGKQSS